jgi:hypothetical protein
MSQIWSVVVRGAVVCGKIRLNGGVCGRCGAGLDGGVGCRWWDDNSVQVRTQGDRCRYPNSRIQRGNCRVQEHLLRRLGCRWARRGSTSGDIAFRGPRASYLSWARVIGTVSLVCRRSFGGCFRSRSCGILHSWSLPIGGVSLMR